MKIGIDGTVFDGRLTGIGNYSYYLLKSVAKFMPDDQFIIYSPFPLAIKFEEPNIYVRTIKHWPRSLSIVWRIIGQAIIAYNDKLDIFWAANGAAPVVMPCPVCLTVYDFVYRVEPSSMTWKGRIFKKLSQELWIKKSETIFTISNDVAEQLYKYCGRRADAVILPSVDDNYYPRDKGDVELIKQKYNITSNYNIVVGTIEPRKNIALFVQAYIDFWMNHSSVNVNKLIIVGRAGWAKKIDISTLKLAEEKGIISLLGYIDKDDLPVLYSGAKLFFMPSTYEGFGMPILEARICGCPVICSDIPAMREAGGKQTYYHKPTYDGIYGMLIDLYINKRKVLSDNGKGVDWTWNTGGKKLAELLCNKSVNNYSSVRGNN